LQSSAPALIERITMYAKFWKRFFDFTLSLLALIVLSPVLLVLTALGAVCMRGNPFFAQKRPGYHEKIFRLIKFRTMSNAKNAEGKLLPDSVRLNKYGRFLRATSLDELPELLNILAGQMAIVRPRPLSLMYLPYYTDEERKRHNVRPGLTGLAQVSGRNATTWEQRFHYDLEYVSHVTLAEDLRILFKTVAVVLKRDGVCERGVDSLPDFDACRSK